MARGNTALYSEGGSAVVSTASDSLLSTAPPDTTGASLMEAAAGTSNGISVNAVVSMGGGASGGTATATSHTATAAVAVAVAIAVEMAVAGGRISSSTSLKNATTLGVRATTCGDTRIRAHTH